MYILLKNDKEIQINPVLTEAKKRTCYNVDGEYALTKQLLGENSSLMSVSQSSDADSFDFVPYFPETATQVNRIIEEAYGIDFNQVKNGGGSLKSLEELVRNNFEKREKYDWRNLKKSLILIILLHQIIGN